MAHKIIYKGHEHKMSVAELCDDGSVKIYPYVSEIASTRFYNGTIEVRVEDGALVVRQLTA